VAWLLNQVVWPQVSDTLSICGMWLDFWTYEKGYPMGYRPFVPLFVRGRLHTAVSKYKQCSGLCLKHRNILQFFPFFTNDRGKIKDKIKLSLRFVQSRHISSTALVFPLRSYFILFNFIKLEIALPPDRQFRCRIRMKSGNFRELHGTMLICRMFKQNWIMRVLAPLIIEIEAKNSKRNETNFFLNICVVIYL
jgi:hypothetical protein